MKNTLAPRHENSEYMHSGDCSDSSSLVPRYGDLSGFSFDTVWIWAFLILLPLPWSGLPANLFTYARLCESIQSWTDNLKKKCRLNTWKKKKNKLICCTFTQICSHTHTDVALRLEALNKQTNNGTSWSLLRPDYHVMACQGHSNNSVSLIN